MSELDLLSVAADGMGVQRALLDVAARNVAAAQASSPEHPYPRLVARFASADPSDAFLDVSDDDDDTGGGLGGTRLVGTARSGETADALTDMIARARRAARVRGERLVSAWRWRPAHDAVFRLISTVTR